MPTKRAMTLPMVCKTCYVTLKLSRAKCLPYFLLWRWSKPTVSADQYRIKSCSNFYGSRGFRGPAVLVSFFS